MSMVELAVYNNARISGSLFGGLYVLTVAQLYRLSPEVNSPSLIAPEPAPTLQQNPGLTNI